MALKTQQCQMCNQGLSSFGSEKFNGPQSYSIVQNARTDIHSTSQSSM